MSFIAQFFNLCHSPLIPERIETNSTIGEVITSCFANVLLPTSLALFSSFGFGFLIFYGFIILSPKLETTKLLISKFVLSFFCVLLSFIRLIYDFTDGKDSESIIGNLAVLIIYKSAFGCYIRCWYSGIPSSIWLHLIYFLRLITVLPQGILLNSSISPNFMEIGFLRCETILLFFLIILLCFADRFPQSYYENSTNQMLSTSSISTIFYAEAAKLLSIGYKSGVKITDLWPLNSRNQPSTLLASFKNDLRNSKRNKNSFIPWLLIILIKSDCIQFLAALILAILFSIFIIADPLFLKLVISSNENQMPLWWGIFLIAATFFTSFVRLLLNARCDFYRFNIFDNARTILVDFVYKKLLKLSAHSKAKYSAGQIVNFLSVDVAIIGHFIMGLPELLNTIITVIVCLLGLYSIIGKNVYYGITTIACFLPFNFVIFKLFTKIQKEQMKVKDSRLKMITDILSGIKILKFYAWEKPMQKMVMKNRNAEIKLQKKMHFASVLTTIAFNAYPIVATIVCLIGFVVIDGKTLTPEVSFMTLMLFNLMRTSIYAIPNIGQKFIKAKISMDRLQQFFDESEIKPLQNTMESSSKDTIMEFCDSSFSFMPPSTEESVPVLKSLNLEIREGELIGIIGRVGAGKSSLLSSICGELYQTSGFCFRKSPLSIAYVPQEAWIQNLSLRDNILFGKKFDKAFYQKTIEVCALKDDLRQFVAGDATEIGERGLNLSGGQKARVALARAVYHDSDLYILDDTLSAVDSHVGAHIFQNVIGNDGGILKGKTRIFALNSITFLPKMDKIFVLKEGFIVDAGTFEELTSRQNETFIELVKEFSMKKEHQNEDDEIIAVEEKHTKIAEDQSMDFESLSNGKLINEETTSVETVSFNMYLRYMKAFGIKLAVTYFITLFIIRTFVESYSQIWMAKWSSNLGNEEKDNIVNLKIYGFLSISSCILIGLSATLVAYGAANASKSFYENLLASLMRSPMAFFDSTPMGRILGRICGDIEQLDFVIPQGIRYLAKLVADCFFYSVTAFYVLPQMSVLVVPMIYVIAKILKYYTKTSVQLRRLGTNSWSKVTSHFQESSIGTSTLRIFGREKEFSQKSINFITTTAEARYAANIVARWAQVIFEILVSMFSAFLTMGAMYFGSTGTLTPSSVALVASTGALLKGFFAEITREIICLESNIVSVEKVQEYVNNEHEAEWTSSIPPPTSWPSNGNIEFKDFSLRYRPCTPMVLKKLNLKIKGGEKVGIVGRTGAGKTSLTMALFRMIEPSEGTILIDSLDFKTLGLHDLRKALTIIPQDPVLFCGTLRINLDPFEEFSDAEIWSAIVKAHLRHFVDAFEEKLNHEISEGGGNLSVGQRQLVCLARAILRKQTKILILDEATAAVDGETDSLIQGSIRALFTECTILTIAHRLNTIMDYDKVLVMDAGEIREFDSPKSLLSNKSSLFYSLALQAKIV